MKIVDYLSPENVLPELSARTGDGVLEEFAQHLKSTGKIGDAASLVEILRDREKLGSTGIGHGVAIPHGRLRGLKEIIIAFGRSVQGIDFDAHDGQPVNLFFLLVAPEDSAGMHLKALARISRIVKNPECREALIKTASSGGIYGVISEEDERH